LLHIYATSALVGELIGQTTLTKDGLLPSRRASCYSSFTSGTLVVSFKDVYSLQPFFITTYYNGEFGCIVFTPSLYQINRCKALLIGENNVKIYVKENESNICIKPKSNTNGSIAIQLIDSPNYAAVTTSNISDFDISGYKEIIPNSI